MCTAISIKTNDGGVYLGRNMDLPQNFGEAPTLIPKGMEWYNRASGKIMHTKKQILGMGTVIDGHPTFAEAMNESSLACAALNFEGFADWSLERKNGLTDIAPYDLILWALSYHSSLNELLHSLKNINIIGIPISEEIPLPTLHWIFTDKTGNSAVVERTHDGLQTYDNPVGVLSNNPTFDWHLTNLREYLQLSPKHPAPIKWAGKTLESLGVGTGTRGIPGDFGSVSRFVRAAFIRAHMPKDLSRSEAPAQLFHMLEYVSMVKGGVLTDDGIEDLTLYSSCMDLCSGIYYYRTCGNSRINAIRLRADANSKTPIVFPYNSAQDTVFLN